MRKFFALTLSFLAAIIGNAELSGKSSNWKGYQRVDFSIDGRNCYVVQPNEPKAGHPWVWRARFPGWHVEMDELLLKRGISVAYMDVSNLFGSPKAVAHWDAFYNHLVKNGYAKKPALECVSRGGLIAYNWAKKNPEKVACIYAEAPVCDVKSWPGGKASGKGSPGDWEKAQQAYGMTETELIAWKDNPIDNLDALAKAKVPILHMLGPNDKIVPNHENSYVLIQNYVQLGGRASVWGNTTQPHKLDGHHFPIEDPAYGADFIETNLAAANPTKKSYVTSRGGLGNSKIIFATRKDARVAYLGGSITTMPWPKLLSTKIQKRYPNVKFDFVHAGIPSMGSTPHAHRLNRDVFHRGKVDLLFVEAAVNDHHNGRTPKEITRAMEGIIRQARTHNPEIDVVFMHFAEPAKTDEYRQGKIPMVIATQEKVAVHYNVPSLNLAKEVQERMDAGEFTWKKDFRNLHPSPFGQKLYAESMDAMLGDFWAGSVDADDKVQVRLLPETLDPQNYSGGGFVPIQSVPQAEGWRVAPKWKPKKGGTRPGFVNVPMLTSEKPGAVLTLDFEGRSIGVFVAAGYDAGIAEFSINDGPWQQRDLFTKWSRGLHIPWLHVLNGDLKPGKHSLRLRMSEKKNAASQGHACRIATFTVNK